MPNFIVWCWIVFAVNVICPWKLNMSSKNFPENRDPFLAEFFNLQVLYFFKKEKKELRIYFDNSITKKNYINLFSKYPICYSKIPFQFFFTSIAIHILKFLFSRLLECNHYRNFCRLLVGSVPIHICKNFGFFLFTSEITKVDSLYVNSKMYLKSQRIFISFSPKEIDVNYRISLTITFYSVNSSEETWAWCFLETFLRWDKQPHWTE